MAVIFPDDSCVSGSRTDVGNACQEPRFTKRCFNGQLKEGGDEALEEVAELVGQGEETVMAAVKSGVLRRSFPLLCDEQWP